MPIFVLTTKVFLSHQQALPPNNRLHKGCNKFTIKLSYSCMPNMACIIKSHNNKLKYPTINADKMSCNCRTKSECPLNRKCRIKSIVCKPPSQLQTSQHGTILDFVRPSSKPGFRTIARHSKTNEK